MPYCRQGLCMNEAAHYCADHGGEERWWLEQQQKEARTEARARSHSFKPKGQAVPEGQGLSQFLPPEERKRRADDKRAKRAEREAKRESLRKERLEARPAKGGGGQKDEGGNGTSRKAQQKAKKRHAGSRYYTARR